MTRAQPQARGRFPAALAALVALTIAMVLGSAGPAAAHASSISTDPAEGAVLATAPDRISFAFDEPIVAVRDGVEVFDAEGRSISSSVTVTGAELGVRLTEPVADGTVVITWRVVSTDGHPVTGSLTFAVGAPSASVTTQRVAQASTTAPLSLSVTRWTGYVALLLAAGLVAFTLLPLRPGAGIEGVHRRVVTVTRTATAVAAASWLLALPLAGAYQLGEGARASVSGRVWATLATADHVVAGAVVLGLLAAVALLGDGQPTRTRSVWAVAAAAVAAAAPAFTGHTRAASPEALAVAADVLHLLTGGVWLGGLVGLALVLPVLTAARGTAAAQVVAGFSGLAAGVLALLVLAGSVLAWRIVGSWPALVDTGYGRLLLLKVGIATIALLIAAWNRFSLVPSLQRSDDLIGQQRGGRLVARSTAAEAAVLVAVVLVTGLLVDTSPEGARAAATERPAGTGSGDVVTRTATLGDVVVEADLSPLTAGPTELTIRLRHSGGGPAVGVESLSARLASDSADLGDIPLTFIAEGTYESELVLPAPGAWRLQVSVRRSEFVNPVTTLDFTVASR